MTFTSSAFFGWYIREIFTYSPEVRKKKTSFHIPTNHNIFQHLENVILYRIIKLIFYEREVFDIKYFYSNL